MHEATAARRRLAQAILVGILSASVGGAFGLPADYAVPALGAPGHSFECGPDTAPSGPYLQRTTYRVFDYDCLTGALIPGPAVPTESMCVNDASGLLGIRGTIGACAFAHATSDTDYQATFVVALVGSYDYGHGIAHESGVPEPLLECHDEPGACRPLGTGLPIAPSLGAGVTFLHSAVAGSVTCDAEARTVEAHLDIWGPLGVIGTRHHSVANLCL